MINIRKLVAVDMVWLGSRVILAEYALGVVLPLALGLITLRAGLLKSVQVGWQIIFGLWLIGIAMNYIPMFIYAVLIARGKTAKEEGQPELARTKKYGVQQVIILVPLFVVILTILQENSRRKR